MKQVLLIGGKAVIDEVPAPDVSDRCIQVLVHYSCVSVGTESSNMMVASESLYQRALKHPEKVLSGLKMLREQGLSRTIKKIQGATSTRLPLGYSASGIVINVGVEVEKFKIGDRVACAGAGVANHAEVITVPVNLAVHIPDSLDLKDASTVTLGAIALQGVRRTAPTIGETVVVIGLGILGQLTVQILRANGCNVIGVDTDPVRLQIAIQSGLEIGVDPKEQDVIKKILWETNGVGADAVLITAASTSHEIISHAMRSCRKKGRVVLVGDVGLDLEREDFYRKELDLLISTSYGPGRYDPVYEDEGQDYPLPYVRWTENRNMSAYLQLLNDKKIKLDPLQPEVTRMQDAELLYARLTTEGQKPILAILNYVEGSEAKLQRNNITLHDRKEQVGRLRVAIIGAGDFAQGVHLPNLSRLSDKYVVRWVVSRSGAKAKTVASQYGSMFAGTNYHDALNDPDVDLILIATRHHLHGQIVLDALKAGKHVFVEKPLALNDTELSEIESFYSSKFSHKPLLVTGFNRRHAPAVQHIKKVLYGRTGPMMISYRMNAGYLPPDHWVHGPEGGGRNIGEACHIYDLFAYLTQAEPIACVATPLNKLAGGCRSNENFVATISYSDGSVCTLQYNSIGNTAYPKETMEIFVDQKVIELNDYKKIEIKGKNNSNWSSALNDKGQMQELVALFDLIRGRDSFSMSEQFVTTRLSFTIEKLLKQV